MAELSDDDRQLVELKYFQDLKYREISEQTGLTVGNVGYRLHHILNRIANQRLAASGSAKSRTRSFRNRTVPPLPWC